MKALNFIERLALCKLNRAFTVSVRSAAMRKPSKGVETAAGQL